MAESETPLEASRVYDRIWVGSRPPFDQPLRHFHVLVLCAAEIQPDRLAFAGDVIRPAFHDAAPSAGEVYRAQQAARYVAERHRRGQRCLITCAAGLNRSALVAGLALIQLTRMSADNAVMLIRHARGPSALHNPHFVAILNQAAATRSRR